ncbi:MULTISPECIES: hypothetical protein [Streptomyces]|uniref:Uncharacterized protein n=1 Tax=Streptomyces griseiscabiei TaxID=2993540 RepID=A0ABU4LJL3_9ACTN|nr:MULTISPECIES: hypothetical protein [Streptomyces]MBZ3908869.1 hypothetical protein [Streptomyces griseiscabiei]MDX2855192.1 hypothetical protein [Streptomyces scabiei]MDX2916012.1 hypothetical protein [Streptomyces griseiscabiei]
MLSQPEQPWQPGPNDLPFTTHLINPHGDRHLGFNDVEGRFYRLWQHRDPEPLHTGDAILLRPSDIDQIIKFSMIWVKNHPTNPRSSDLSDELAAGAKAVVLHFAQAAQAPVQR